MNNDFQGELLKEMNKDLDYLINPPKKKKIIRRPDFDTALVIFVSVFFAVYFLYPYLIHYFKL